MPATRKAPHDPIRPRRENQISAVYRLALADGTVVDSVPESEPATLRPRDVLPALEAALVRMKVGSHWRIVIPPQLAHGTAGFGPLIGPHAALIYDLEQRKILRSRQRRSSIPEIHHGAPGVRPASMAGRPWHRPVKVRNERRRRRRSLRGIG